jgi:hypothetical protein
MTKTVTQLDDEGYFVGTTIADKSPLEPNVYLIPRNCIEVEPPQIPDGYKAKWNNGWELELIPVPEVLPEYAPTYADYRASEYPPMADYLDGIVKGDQAQIQAYIDACQAVKNKYPKGE